MSRSMLEPKKQIDLKVFGDKFLPWSEIVHEFLQKYSSY